MATTDNCIQYDIIFLNTFEKYLGLKQQTDGSLLEVAEVGMLQRDRMVELAVTGVNGIPVDSRHGRDHADGSDTKTVVSGARNNNIALGRWTNSFQIRNVASKTGPLRIIAWNKYLNKFHYFYIPNSAYSHIKASLEIIIERVSGVYDAPDWSGVPNLDWKWWSYECDSFEEMAAMQGDPWQENFDEFFTILN